MSKQFASRGDLTAKPVTFTRLSDNAYAYTTEGDPNSGVIIGDDACMVIDTTATPVMAQDLIRRIRSVTDKPIKYVVLLALPCGARIGCIGLFRSWCHRDHRQQGHL